MNHLRISEIFYSLQGEGLHVGTPAVFIRLAGCNLKCDWCDTPYALDGNESLKFTPEDIRILFAKNGWWTRLDDYAHLVFTGGEPMLQQDGIVALYEDFNNFHDQNGRKFDPIGEIETNGTIPLTSKDLPYHITDLTVSPKLEHSGIPKKQRYKPDVLQKYLDEWYTLAWKFVIEKDEDMKEVISDFVIPFSIPHEDVWLMAAGRTQAELAGRAEAVAELCKEYGFKYSPRLHIDLWKGERAK